MLDKHTIYSLCGLFSVITVCTFTWATVTDAIAIKEKSKILNKLASEGSINDSKECVENS